MQQVGEIVTYILVIWKYMSWPVLISGGAIERSLVLDWMLEFQD